jgi:S-adenosylmethionine:tRNA ribosyltransferase-isomerase
MKLQDLDFSYPEELIATEPVRPSRVLLCKDEQITEISIQDLLNKIPAGDVFVVNDTKVLKRRIFAKHNSEEIEILFLSSRDNKTWEVLFPSKKFALGHVIELPLGVQLKLLQKGRPQIVELSQVVDEKYFQQVAELPLPPYIQKARGMRHNQSQDESWYQTAWAANAGSFASPTASLHFSSQDLQQLRDKGVHVLNVTLHVGLGTFLPVQVEDLNDHQMHEEFVEISKENWSIIQEQKSKGLKIWALGTTVTRSLESKAHDMLTQNANGDWCGFTRLLIQPGFQWQVVDRLMTNFHQPKSTLLALVAGFSGLNQVKRVYEIAIEKKMRLFSYGDLSVWIK